MRKEVGKKHRENYIMLSRIYMLTNYQLIDFFMIFKSNKKKKSMLGKNILKIIGSIRWEQVIYSG